MALRSDLRQWLIYDPQTVEDVLDVLEASALVMFGSWLQQRARNLPTVVGDNLGTLGSVLWEIGNARQQINAGLAPTEHLNEATDTHVAAQQGWDKFVRWIQGDTSIPVEDVAAVIDEISGAAAYLHQRTTETGTNHPRWVSRLVAGRPCSSCGR